MAYCSIGHMGYALVGLAAGSAEGVQGVIVYLAIYLAMTLGTFACILAMRRNGRMVENIADLSGLSRTNPLMAFMLAMLLFSLAGIPPLAGFFAKFYVFLAAIEAGLYWLAVIGVCQAWSAPTIICASSRSCISTSRPSASSRCRLALPRVLGVERRYSSVFFVYPAPLVAIAEAAAKSLF